MVYFTRISAVPLRRYILRDILVSLLCALHCLVKPLPEVVDYSYSMDVRARTATLHERRSLNPKLRVAGFPHVISAVRCLFVVLIFR